MGSRSLHCRLLPPAKTDSPEPLRVSGLCVLQLRNGTIGLSDEADADQADCPMRYDSHTLVESRQCVPGLAGFRLLGARHTVSDVHRLSPWRPSLSVTFEPIRKLFPFSVRIMISAILTQVNSNIMNLLLGRYYGEANTGHYNQAYQWSSKCFLLVGNMLKQVDQTVLVGLDDERERQLVVLRKMMRFTAFISFPLLFGLGLVAHEFITLAIGEKWLFAASLLPLLCLSGAFMPLSTLLTDAVISQHRSDIYLWSTLVLGVLQIGLMVGLWQQGIYTMVVAYTLLNILWVFVWHLFVRRLMGYGLLAFLKDIVPFALAAAAVMAATGFMTQGIDNLWLKLLIRVVTASLLYYAVMRLAGAVILQECMDFIFSKRKRH